MIRPTRTGPYITKYMPPSGSFSISDHGQWNMRWTDDGSRFDVTLNGTITFTDDLTDVQTLSSGVRLISKPSALHVPPWQLVSARLGGVPLRTATWWTAPAIPATDAATKIACWDAALGKPGAVAIATTGTWSGKTIGLQGGPSPDRNHGKIGVSTGGDHPYAIFGDMNQQGALGPAAKCGSSQNGRGGLFFVVEDRALHDSVAALIAGDSAPVAK